MEGEINSLMSVLLHVWITWLQTPAAEFSLSFAYKQIKGETRANANEGGVGSRITQVKPSDEEMSEIYCRIELNAIFGGTDLPIQKNHRTSPAAAILTSDLQNQDPDPFLSADMEAAVSRCGDHKQLS